MFYFLWVGNIGKGDLLRRTIICVHCNLALQNGRNRKSFDGTKKIPHKYLGGVNIKPSITWLEMPIWIGNPPETTEVE